MSITYVVNKFRVDDGKKLVGLTCTDTKNNQFSVDKRLDIVDGTSDADYVKQAYTAALTEINEWAAGVAVQGMVFNPDDNSLSDTSSE